MKKVLIAAAIEVAIYAGKKILDLVEKRYSKANA